jgi:hypothetical protein
MFGWRKKANILNPLKREISDEEYENWEKMDGLLGG